MDVVVPPGCGPGSSVEFTDAAGRTLTAVVPDGFAEGDVFNVEAEMPEDFVEDILEALTQTDFVKVLDDYIKGECLTFLDCGNGEYSLDQTESHENYVRLYESRIEGYLVEHGVGSNGFLDTLLQTHLRGPDKMLLDSLRDSLLAVQDFETFAKRCHEEALVAASADS